jgi:hypothetical protein
MSAIFNDANHWRERARQARHLAEQLPAGESKTTMLEIAINYERLAERAEIRMRQNGDQL